LKFPDYAVAASVTDPDGRFMTGFLFPSELRWQDQEEAKIIARTDDGAIAAQANFRLVEPVSQLIDTPTATVEPPAIPTIPLELTTSPTVPSTPTATPTEISTPTLPSPPPAQPSVSATTNLNIRSGPGTVYSILGLLPAGHSAEVTGVDPRSHSPTDLHSHPRTIPFSY